MSATDTPQTARPRAGLLNAGRRVPPLRLSSIDSRQIDAARAICIFLMLAVHVYPAQTAPTLIFEGPLHPLWIVWIDILGRASVAALSFLGGYILWRQGSGRSPGTLLRGRLLSVYLPMVSWNLVVIALTVVAALAAGMGGAAMAEQLGFDGPMDALNAVFALTDYPALIPLAFLRDLVISTVIARLLMPAMHLVWAPALAIAAAMAVTGMSEPLLLRPAILLFVLLGVEAARRAELETLSSTRLALPLALGAALLAFGTSRLPGLPQTVATELPIILKRFALVFAVLWATRAVVNRWGAHGVSRLRQPIFLTYLCHGVVAIILGRMWEATGLALTSWAYLGFFCLSIAVFLVAGFLLNRILPHLPGQLPVAFGARPDRA